MRKCPLERFIGKPPHLHKVIEKGHMGSGGSEIDRIVIATTGMDFFAASNVNMTLLLLQREEPFFPCKELVVPSCFLVYLLQYSPSALNSYKPLLCFFLHGSFDL